jgi:hypothetical protein
MNVVIVVDATSHLENQVRAVCRPLQQKGGEGAEAAIAILDECEFLCNISTVFLHYFEIAGII